MNHHRRLVLHIVEEVHRIGAAAPMHNVFAVQRVFRHLLAHRADGAVVEHAVLLVCFSKTAGQRVVTLPCCSVLIHVFFLLDYFR